MTDEEKEAKRELMAMSKERLFLVDHDNLKWVCRVEDCECYTKIKDFGICPWYFWRSKWLNLNFYYFLCGKHGKQQKAGMKLPLKEIGVNQYNLKPFDQ